MTVQLPPSGGYIIAGPTSSGKSQLMKRLLYEAEDMFTEPPKRILYCYTTHQPMFDEMSGKLDNITFHKGIPTDACIDNLTRDGGCNALVLDDLSQKCINSEHFLKIWTVDAHHRRLSTFLLVQNLFLKGKYARDISLNAHYMIILRSLRDMAQIKYLGAQVFARRGKGLEEAYHDAINSQKYGYLLIDLSPHTNDKYRLRTRIFPGEETIVYCLNP